MALSIIPVLVGGSRTRAIRALVRLPTALIVGNQDVAAMTALLRAGHLASAGIIVLLAEHLALSLAASLRGTACLPTLGQVVPSTSAPGRAGIPNRERRINVLPGSPYPEVVALRRALDHSIG